MGDKAPWIHWMDHPISSGNIDDGIQHSAPLPIFLQVRVKIVKSEAFFKQCEKCS